MIDIAPGLRAALPPNDPMVFPFTSTGTLGTAYTGPLHDNTPLYDDPPTTLRLGHDDRGLNKSVQHGYGYRSHINDHPDRPPAEDEYEPSHLPGLPRHLTGETKGSGYTTGVTVVPRTGGRRVGGANPVAPAIYGRGLPVGVSPGQIKARSDEIDRVHAEVFRDTANTIKPASGHGLPYGF